MINLLSPGGARKASMRPQKLGTKSYACPFRIASHHKHMVLRTFHGCGTGTISNPTPLDVRTTDASEATIEMHFLIARMCLRNAQIETSSARWSKSIACCCFKCQQAVNSFQRSLPLLQSTRVVLAHLLLVHMLHTCAIYKPRKTLTAPSEGRCLPVLLHMSVCAYTKDLAYLSCAYKSAAEVHHLNRMRNKLPFIPLSHPSLKEAQS
jgi:hypothetical protein